MRAAEPRLRASLRQVDESKASFYPQISLTGNMGTGREQLARLLYNPVATVGTNAVLPSLNIREANLQIKVSKARYEEAIDNFRGSMLTAFAEVAEGHRIAPVSARRR